MRDDQNKYISQGDPWMRAAEEARAELIRSPPLPLATGRRSIYDMCVRGEMAWREESLFSFSDDEDDEIAAEYMALLAQVQEASGMGDATALRRLRGEVEAVRTELDSMDAYSLAYVFGQIRARLEAQVEVEFSVADAHAASATFPSQSRSDQSEPGRFNGPAPFYRRGRAYLRAVLTAVEMAAANPKNLGWRHAYADQLLRAVEETDSPQDLHDFVAGMAYELSRTMATFPDTEQEPQSPINDEPPF